MQGPGARELRAAEAATTLCAANRTTPYNGKFVTVTGVVTGRGLHSCTNQLNLSRFCH